MKEEQEVVDLQHAQRAEFGLDDETLNALLDEDLDTPKDPAPPKDPDEKDIKDPGDVKPKDPDDKKLDPNAKDPQAAVAGVTDPAAQATDEKDDESAVKDDSPVDENDPMYGIKQLLDVVREARIKAEKEYAEKSEAESTTEDEDAKAQTPDPKVDPQLIQDDPKDPTPVATLASAPIAVDPKKGAAPVKPPIKDGLSESEAKIVELQTKLEETLLRYPAVLRAYLDNRFKNYGPKDSHDIFEHVSKLTGFMQTYRDQTKFIMEGLEQIDLFMTNSLFTSPTESCLGEETKIDLIVFQEFFAIVDEHYDVIDQQNPKVALNLKIKLANLPTVDANVDRTKFKKVFLDQAAQNAIMIDHFLEREDQSIALAIQQLNTKTMTEKEAKRLARDLSQNSRLSLSNQQKLIDALTPLMKHHAPSSWDNAQQTLAALKKCFTITSLVGNPYQDPWNYGYYQQPAHSGLTSLYFACKAKHYFETHDAVPKWYHATNYQNLTPIITSNEIKVMHKQAYNGAWVSMAREPSMGDCVFVFKDISHIDPNVFIGYEKGKIRWRGLQNPIPLVAPGKKGQVDANVILVGLAPTYQKTHKVAIVQLFKDKGIADPKIVSVELVDYIQREIMLKIGNPNLTDKWWGRADAQHLDKPLAPQPGQPGYGG